MFAFSRSATPSPPPAPELFWGPVTSNYNWCEADYAVSRYVAEFFNTISSIPTFTVGLYFLLKARKHKYGFRFSLAGAMLALVGIGSVSFHGTLTRAGQILDEVPMLYSSSIFLWISGSLHLPVGTKGDAQSVKLGLALLAYCVIVTAAYANGGFEVRGKGDKMGGCCKGGGRTRGGWGGWGGEEGAAANVQQTGDITVINFPKTLVSLPPPTRCEPLCTSYVRNVRALFKTKHLPLPQSKRSFYYTCDSDE